MKKKILPLLLLFIVSHLPYALSEDGSGAPIVGMQDNQSDTDQPDTYLPLVENYPSFTLEPLRIDFLYNKSNQPVLFHDMKKFDWHGLLRGNGSILYAIRINRSRFAFCVGGGWSTLHYAGRGKKDQSDDEMRYPALKRQSKSKTEYEYVDNKLEKKVSYTAIKIPFVDALFRLRFNSVLDDPKAGLHTWLGLKLGFRRGASQIMHYKEYDDSSASSVEHGFFNLKSYAWAFQAGIGYGRFGLTGGFHFTSLFKEKEGPSGSDALRPFSFGAYIDLL